MASQQYALQEAPHDASQTEWANITLFASEYHPSNGQVWHFTVRRRTAVIIALALLFHIALLWLILVKTSSIERDKKRGENQVAMVYFPTPPAPPTPTPTPQPPQPPSKTIPLAANKPRFTPPPKSSSALPPPPVTVPTITPPPQEEDDMMARIEANRKRRALEAQALAQNEEVEDDNQRALRIAKANFAASQKRAGSDKEESGGVFQIDRQSFSSAEFTFRGWNATMRRMWPQKYEVRQGQEPDIEVAIVKKMIEVIRKYKDGDFQFESQRMGRTITLSARVGDTAQLQQFLLREFFPNYKQTSLN